MITKQPKLVLHYSPGILTVLRRDPCPGQNLGPHGGHGHSSCGCDRNQDIFKIAGRPYVLQPGEETWCLDGCWINREKVRS